MTSRYAEFRKSESNWGRWGADDQLGTVNLIDAENRREAASLVRHGRLVSMARRIPNQPAPNNPFPAQHFVERHAYPALPGGAEYACDYVGLASHVVECTHIDALCHIWDNDVMWNGRSPDTAIAFDGGGVRWGGVHNFKGGIVTRGVLLDVAASRPDGHVSQDRPVTAEELLAVAAAQSTEVRPGDAVVIHCGRDVWQRAEADRRYGSTPGYRPGLHASCLEPLRTWDCSVLVWDMLDALPAEDAGGWTVHGAIPSFGLALIDNAYLEPLAAACAEIGTYEFMLCIAPLWIEGGTNSPVNPLALL
ncbi:MAG: hypothetical protein QOI86_1394 [Actinomycetota bacterium]|nr:hypothetical protein [Actinomycetota bacterium]